MVDNKLLLREAPDMVLLLDFLDCCCTDDGVFRRTDVVEVEGFFIWEDLMCFLKDLE